MTNIRTSLPIPTQPWESAKNKFLEDLSPEEVKRFQDATLENVFYDSSSAQRKHAQGSRAWAMQEKLLSLVEGIDDYGKALDVYSNAYGLILCPIWGSVRVVLHIAREAGRFQEKIVDMFARIGDALPRFRIYQILFRNHERLLRALSVAYLDIIKFCIMAKGFFVRARSSAIPMAIICKAIWKPFQKQFDEYIAAFRTHQKRVEKEAGLAHLIESARSREIEVANRALQERNQKVQRRHKLLSALPGVEYETKHAKVIGYRHPGPTHGSSLMLPSLVGMAPKIRTVCPVSAFLALGTQPNSFVGFHYCDYADSSSLDATRIIASIIKQALLRLPLDYFDDTFQCPFDTDGPVPSHTKYQDFLFRILEHYPEVFIVLDGIDELAQHEQTIVLKLIGDLLQCNHARIKILVTSRSEEYMIRESLERYRTIDIVADHNEADIALFVMEKLETTIFNHQRGFDDSALKHDIVRALVNGANGMFLWVKFQLDDICEALTEESIRQTLRNLPKDLSETYRRIIEKIHDGPGGTQKVDKMWKIIRWVICARRPLLIDELEEAIGLEKTDKRLHTERSAKGVGRKLCGNLLVYNKEDRTVSLVHHSLKQYLCNSSPESVLHFDFSLADTEIGEICVAYLNFSDFETQLINIPAPVVVDEQQAERIIWGSMPLSPYVRDFASRLLNWRTPTSGKSSTLQFPLPVLVRPASTLTAKYALLQYIIESWAFHTARFTPNTSHWASLKNLVFERQLAFESRPWNARPINAQMFLDSDSPRWMPLYSWALEHGIWSFLHLLMSKSVVQKELWNYVQRKYQLPATSMDFFNIMSCQYHHNSFSHSQWIYECAKVPSPGLTLACLELRHHMCHETTSSFDSIIEQSVMLAIKSEDHIAIKNIIGTYVTKRDDVSRLLALVVKYGLAENDHVISTVLTCWNSSNEDLAYDPNSATRDCELAFALYRCLPTIIDAVRNKMIPFHGICTHYRWIITLLALSSALKYHTFLMLAFSENIFFDYYRLFIMPTDDRINNTLWSRNISQKLNSLRGKSVCAIAFENIRGDPTPDPEYDLAAFESVLNIFVKRFSNFSWPRVFMMDLENEGIHCLEWAARWGLGSVVCGLMRSYGVLINKNEADATNSAAALRNVIRYSPSCLDTVLQHTWPEGVVNSVMDDPEFEFSSLKFEVQLKLAEMAGRELRLINGVFQVPRTERRPITSSTMVTVSHHP